MNPEQDGSELITAERGMNSDTPPQIGNSSAKMHSNRGEAMLARTLHDSSVRMHGRVAVYVT